MEQAEAAGGTPACPGAVPAPPLFCLSKRTAHGFATVVGIALLQRDLPYEPATRFGRLLAYTELLLTSTLAALFILAVRRQFKRGGD